MDSSRNYVVVARYHPWHHESCNTSPCICKISRKNDGQKVYTVQGDVSITLTIGKERGSGGSYAYVELIRMSRIAERSV